MMIDQDMERLFDALDRGDGITASAASQNLLQYYISLYIPALGDDANVIMRLGYVKALLSNVVLYAGLLHTGTAAHTIALQQQRIKELDDRIEELHDEARCRDERDE